MATVGATITIRGDSRDAQQAVTAVSRDLREMGRTALGAAGQTVRMSAAILGAESVVAGLRLALQSATQGVRDWLAANDEASAAMATAGDALTTFRAQLGEVVLGGGNAEVAAGALVAVLDELTLSSEGAAQGQALVRSAIAGVLDVTALGIDVLAGARVAWGGLQAAVAIASRGLESFVSVAGTVGAALLDAMVVPLDLVVTGLASVTSGIARLGSVVGGPVERATAGLADGFASVSGSIDDARARIQNFRDTSARGITGAFDGLTSELAGIGEATAASFGGMTDFADRLRDIGDGARDGTIALRGQRQEIERTGTAATTATEALAVLDAKQAAAAEHAAQLSEMKAARIAAAEALAAEAAAASAERQRMAEEALAAAAERRAEVMRSTGAAVGESLALAVSAQRDSSRQIVAIIARELQARIAAALGASALLSATPGGQFAAAAIIAAIGVATSQLASIGGGGGRRGGGGGGGGGTSIGAVNVTVQATNGAAPMDERALAAAVEDGVRRGTIRVGGGR